MRKLLLALAAALVLPAAAAAGGWATAGVSPLPRDATAGTQQSFTVTVRRHGRTLTDGASPAVILIDRDETRLRFPATPTGKTGRYRARVRWREGRWTFTVDDGLAATGYGESRTHAFGAVTVRSAVRSGASVDAELVPLAAAAAALGGAAVLVLRRRGRGRTDSPMRV